SSNAELLHQRISDGEGRAAGRKLLESIGHARNLTHRLLSFSRRQELAPQMIDVGEVVQSTVELTKAFLSDTTRLEVRVECPVQANVDPRQFELAIVNLILNARDATACGGAVAIEVSREVIYPEEAQRLGIEPGDYASLIVSDTGSGMTPEIAAKA